MKTEVEALREEIATLRERVAVLENAHMFRLTPAPIWALPAYVPPSTPVTPWAPPFIVACGGVQSGALQS